MRKPKPTIFEQPVGQVSEGAKARWWRERIMRMTREELASRTGYSPNVIDQYERNCNSAGQPLTERSWKRYRSACAGIHTGMTFDWISLNRADLQRDSREG